jgi:hypothetical protein
MPSDYSKGEHVWIQTLHINLAYMAVQIVVAAVCVTLLCFAGIETNETVDTHRHMHVTDTLIDPMHHHAPNSIRSPIGRVSRRQILRM